MPMINNNKSKILEGSVRLFQCARCLAQVNICTLCDRGNIYCSRSCSVPARKHSRSAASKRYQLTAYGRQNHVLCQRRYRQKQLEKMKVKESESAKMIDQGSSANPHELSSPVMDEGISESKETHRYCDFCGRQCNPYTRRDFLNHYRRSKVIMSSSSMAFAQGP